MKPTLEQGRYRWPAWLLALLLAACAGPQAPDWKIDAQGALTRHQRAVLLGDATAARAEFARARDALARTGRADLVAHAELVRCAMRVAVLEFDDCPGFAALAPEAGPALQAYADYLAGRPTTAALLPPQHRALADRGAVGTLSSVSDPVSRLVAAGALLRRGQAGDAEIALAIDTASAQGWRRALLAWLSLQEARALAAGDQATAAAARRRIELATTPTVR